MLLCLPLTISFTGGDRTCWRPSQYELYLLVVDPLEDRMASYRSIIEKTTPVRHFCDDITEKQLTFPARQAGLRDPAASDHRVHPNRSIHQNVLTDFCSSATAFFIIFAIQSPGTYTAFFQFVIMLLRRAIAQF